MSNPHNCAGFRKDGTPCAAIVPLGAEYCWGHDPKNREQRTQIASKAASAKNAKPTELTEIKTTLKSLGDAVRLGQTDRGNASVAAQVYGVLIKSIEQQRKQRELEELEVLLEDAYAEIDRLKAERDSRHGAWGA